ncbi:hypothetical protein Bca52824_090731 [Brassica carinata]|uniref:Neprosin PEP catalytic domain-containing protein n=1 Tax=Brassica carinata TaxID=52824 RepID=A0A8X7NY46_BRACI|nr:hypothetical protein Bca52824_090731 [Brassica carinata]
MTVYEWLNKNHSRLFTYWTADGFIKTGCFNTLCPGFVQVSTKIPMGYLLEQVYTYGGKQYEIEISIFQDSKTGDWWLIVFNENVGYWPKSLFTEVGLVHGASLISYGGEVYSPVKEEPTHGKWAFPHEGYLKAAYVNGIEVADEIDSKLSKPPISTVNPFSSTPNCYKAETKADSKVPYDAIFYGGPGGCSF